MYQLNASTQIQLRKKLAVEANLHIRISALKELGKDEDIAHIDAPILAESLYRDWAVLHGIEQGFLPDSDATPHLMLIQEACKALVRIVRMGFDISQALGVVDLLCQLQSQCAQSSGDWILTNVYHFYQEMEKAA